MLMNESHQLLNEQKSKLMMLFENQFHMKIFLKVIIHGLILQEVLDAKDLQNIFMENH
jgi:hypothetical protein